MEASSQFMPHIGDTMESSKGRVVRDAYGHDPDCQGCAAPDCGPPEYIPTRGDAVETWLRRYRDSFPKETRQWSALDDLLDEYRLYADTRSPLSMNVEDIRP